ncbi:cysteine desulfurase family protein [Cellulomonas wangsupingiae]|uniref:Aminotransferase class V-fold PLP-dependent enzyme n=1 Tax=Cellulomonas wangsupingiae TaxID=2968085 RepID=A0ABY5K0Q2_9CELL|nr:aminotransferase class V-fold PLP-dependent enzyme [Cellulomonas wangsupingiae]MCC2333488.1 aminotransferase class V-fold PLP-dependent enzyme [Cellulomonas wangsupingiae]UUI63673.1 aminotransferase class V-fold PLP-dependent enzyme [Cellulomonas wangsupingiae]
MTTTVPRDAAPPPRAVLDVAGHAPLRPAARAALLESLDQGWADPRRLHAEGRRARLLLDGAREAIAACLGARTDEVDLVPTHTLALHNAVRSVARGRRRAGADVVVGAVERAALHHVATFVADRSGGEVRTVGVDGYGRVDPEAFAAAATAGTGLAVLQHANGEVGTRQPVEEVHGRLQARGVPLVVDVGASAGHVDVGRAGDVLVADAGDWGGPALGVVVTRAGVRRSPDWPEDEDRWSPGGVHVPVALAAAVALQEAAAGRAAADAHRRGLVDEVRRRVAAEVPDVQVAGDPVDRLPHVVTFSCLYVDGEAIVERLDRAGFGVGSGSACTSSALEPSHVLAAMGVLTQGNVRLSLPPDVEAAAVRRFCDVLPGAVADVRAALGA